MVPSVCLTRVATPVFLAPPTVSVGQFTVSPVPRVQSGPPAATRNLVKLLVVPEPSERCTTTIGFDGKAVPPLSAAIAGSFQFVILTPMIFASVAGLSLRLLAAVLLYDTVIGPATVGT